MKLLVLTQKIDKEDSVLGFFHKWMEELAKRFEKVTVICLEKGEFNLPPNVRVFSLGKEKNKNKFLYVLKFFNLLIFQSLNYDSVFIHMNQEYVLLGGVLWKLLGKKVYFWRNHPRGSLFTRMAVCLSNEVFYTSDGSYTARFKKSIQMPVGIDTEKFSIFNFKFSTRKNKILSLGRIAPIKNTHVLIETAKILDAKGVDFVLDVVGEALGKDQKYFDSFRKEASVLELRGKINFLGNIPNYKTPEIYNTHDIFINLTPSGSLDKTIFEAAACGCLPIVANQSLMGEIPDSLMTDVQAEKLADKIEFWFEIPDRERSKMVEKLREVVVSKHSLERLMDVLEKEIKNE